MKAGHIAVWVGSSVVTIAVIGYMVLLLAVHRERERAYSTAWVTTHLGEPVDSMVNVRFNFCGEGHRYSVQQLMDTTGENMLIADKPMPCPISVTYEFMTGHTLEFPAESFACGMCSGEHEYVLWRDSVSYHYHP